MTKLREAEAERRPTLPEIFADLQAEWRARSRRAAASLERHLSKLESQEPMLRAVVAHRRGDSSAIPRLLRSDHQMTTDDRETLAHFLEGGFDQPLKAGRPKSNERWVGREASLFLADWREIAKRENVSTYGQTEKMRDAAIEFIIAEFVPPSLRNINREAVIGYMTQRGNVRRN